MKFCTKCGAQIEEGKKFCSKCGQEVLIQSSPAKTAPTEIILQGQGLSNNITTQEKQVHIQKVSNKSTKTRKLVAVILGIVLVLAIFSYNIGASLLSRNKVVEKFNQALASKNSSQLAKYIVSSDIKQKIDAKVISGLLNYIDENPSYINEITKSIEKQSLNIALPPSLKSSSKNLFINDKSDINDTYDLFTLKKQGKTWLFYDKYVFELKSIYVTVQTNYKDTQIFIDDNLVCTADKPDYEKEIGPYIPGLYKIKAILKGEHVTLEKSVDLDLVRIDMTNKNQVIKFVELYLDGYKLSVDSDYKDAKLFVNGKDTGLLIKDAKDFGPVSKDGSVKLSAQKDFPWGVIKSEEITLDGDRSVFLKLTVVNDDVTNTLMDTINTFSKSWVKATQLRNASKLVNVSENKKKKIAEDIEAAIANKDLFIGNITKSVFDLDNVYVYQKDNNYYAEITVNESYNASDTISQTNIYDIAKKYTLIYDETSKKWLIDDEEQLYYFNPSNKREFIFINVENDKNIVATEIQSEYIFFFSDTRIISDSELNNLSTALLAYARNEIFARKGYVFIKPEFKNYFESKSWYRPNSNFKGKTEDFNPIEIENIKRIQQYE